MLAVKAQSHIGAEQAVALTVLYCTQSKENYSILA